MTNKGHIKSLDGVRALAILLVMAFHAELIKFGWTGVQLFFVLSGFLITGILWKERQAETTVSFKLKKFWARRFLRIFPLYFAYLGLLGLLFFLTNFPSFFDKYVPYLLTYTFNFTRATADWQFSPAFTHMWSLSVEEQFYIIFPFIIFYCPPKFTRAFMLLVLFCAPLTRFLIGQYYESFSLSAHATGDAVYWNTFSHLDAFFAGGLIPVLSLEKKIAKPMNLLVISTILVLAAGIVNYVSIGLPFSGILEDMGYDHARIDNGQHIWSYSLLNFFFASCILVLVSVHSQHRLSTLRKVFESKWLTEIGKVSYSMYVFHSPILLYFVYRFIHPDSYWIKLALFLPYLLVVYLVSKLSYNLFESKFLKLKDKFFPSGREIVKSETVLGSRRLR